MKKLITLSLTLLAGLSLSACSNDSSSSSKNSSSNKTSNVKKQTSPVSLSNYEKIRIGDVTSGNGGTSKKSVKTMFGKPSMTTDTEVAGSSKKATQYSWNNVATSLKGATVNVDFIDGKAIGKGYVEASNGKKIIGNQYKSINTGDNFKDVKAKLGTPSGEALTGSGATSSQVLTYLDGTKNVSFTFTNNTLLTKTKTDLS